MIKFHQRLKVKDRVPPYYWPKYKTVFLIMHFKTWNHFNIRGLYTVFQLRQHQFSMALKPAVLQRDILNKLVLHGKHIWNDPLWHISGIIDSKYKLQLASFIGDCVKQIIIIKTRFHAGGLSLGTLFSLAHSIVLLICDKTNLLLAL